MNSIFSPGKLEFNKNENISLLTPSTPYQVFLPIVEKAQLVGYFVSPDGSDTNPGTFLLPWKTIGKAAAMVSPGDTVYIRAGIYIEAPRFAISGTESDPIKILAYPGETPVVDGLNQLPLSYRGLVSVFGDWVQISDIEIRNSLYTGLGLYGKHDTANNIYTHHSQKEGIFIGGDYGIVENSLVWRNSMQNEGGISSSWSPGLVAGNDISDGITEYGIIRKNIVWENWGEGINTNEANGTTIEDNISHDNFSTNIYISDATNILCQRNFVFMDPLSYVYGYGSNVGIMMGDELYTPPSANIQVLNNLGYGNHRNFHWWQGVQGGGMYNVLIANNTFVNATGESSLGQGNVIIGLGEHFNVRFINNLVRQDDALPVIATINQPGVYYSNNLWSDPPYPAASGPGDIIADPLLAEFGSPFSPDWFRLLATSPAIGHALSLPEVLVDYFANWRGSMPDMGAVEDFP